MTDAVPRPCTSSEGVDVDQADGLGGWTAVAR
ncbi:MAG: hypothetical protein JWL79_2936 [Frankiales bacterium]|nr:hypothetical protein [Frankiales bacterium]